MGRRWKMFASMVFVVAAIVATIANLPKVINIGQAFSVTGYQVIQIFGVAGWFAVLFLIWDKWRPPSKSERKDLISEWRAMIARVTKWNNEREPVFEQEPVFEEEAVEDYGDYELISHLQQQPEFYSFKTYLKNPDELKEHTLECIVAKIESLEKKWGLK